MSSQPPAHLPPFRPSTAVSQFQCRGHDVLDLLKDARNYDGWLTAQVLAAKPPHSKKIADLGAGRGTFAEMLRARGLEASCVEPDAENQSVLRRLGFQVQAAMDEYPLASLDYVYTLNVLEHVPDDETLVRAVFSRLRSGGRLFVFVPAYPVLWSRFDDYVEHQRRYRRAPMAAMFRRTGFILERTRYADSLGFFAAWLFGRRGRAEVSPRSVRLYDRFLFPVSRFLDPVLGHFFGKNLAVVCRKP